MLALGISILSLHNGSDIFYQDGLICSSLVICLLSIKKNHCSVFYKNEIKLSEQLKKGKLHRARLLINLKAFRSD